MNGAGKKPDAWLSVKLPPEIVRAVKIRAAQKGDTLRATILRALKADGFKVPNSVIQDRRTAANRERSRAGARRAR